MLEAVLSGARDPELSPVEVTATPALAAVVPDVLAADGFVLGTPANIGYMSGALKHFFDTVYYPCLQAKTGAPYGLYVHGASDTTGAGSGRSRASGSHGNVSGFTARCSVTSTRRRTRCVAATH